MIKDKEYYFNEFENFKWSLIKKTSEVDNYRNWSDEFSREIISDLYFTLYEAFNDIDYTKFTSNELKDHFGFSFWNENLILIPVWLLKTIKDGTEVYSISGNKLLVGKNKLDNDNRFGMTAYGFTKSQLRDEKIDEFLDESK